MDANDGLHGCTSVKSCHQSSQANSKSPFLRDRSLVYSYKLPSAMLSLMEFNHLLDEHWSSLLFLLLMMQMGKV